MKNNWKIATSLLKALDILTLVARYPGGISIKELTQFLQQPRTSILRVLETLSFYGLVIKEGSRYIPTDAFYEWTKKDANNSLRIRFSPILKSILTQVKELVVLGQFSGGKIRHISYAEWDHLITINPDSFSLHNLETSAMGKLILSERLDLLDNLKVENKEKLIKEVEACRESGIAWNRGESSPGMTAVAVWAGKPSSVCPMISVSWPDLRFDEKKAAEAVEIIRKEIQAI